MTSSDLLWLTLTLLSFAGATVLQLRLRSPLSNPTLVATVIVVAGLLLTHTPYERYHAAAQPLSALLTPAVVALAIPLYRLRALLKKQWRALVFGGLAGTCLSTGVDIFLPQLLHLDKMSQRALMTVAATSPVALQLAPLTHASPILATTLAVLSGLLGALLLPAWLSFLNIKHPLARGIALGSVSHGIGTARAREEGELTAASSSIGMGLAALTVTLIVAFLG